MKQTPIELMYASLQHTLTDFHKREGKVESFIKNYSKFRFHNHRLILSETNDLPNSRKFYLACFYVKPEDGIWEEVAHDISVYREAFPFMNFMKEDAYQSSIWLTYWMDINKLLDILPTRENIIKKILLEL